jgi:hypothetical protein
MTIRGYDYSFSRPYTSALVAARAGFVGRYLSSVDESKCLTAAEFAELHRAYVPVVLFYEDAAEWMTGGYAAGVARGQAAARQAAAIGLSLNDPVTVNLAADFPATQGQIQLALDCARGFESAYHLGPTGVYGDFAVVQAAADIGLSVVQTVAWSGNQWDSRAHIHQTGAQTILGGVRVDVDEVPGDVYNFGQSHPTPPSWPGRVFTFDPAAPAADMMFGEDIRAWQHRMADRGWPIVPDGWYGKRSAATCLAFQTEFHLLPAPGLTLDGKVGPATWAATWTIPITL